VPSNEEIVQRVIQKLTEKTGGMHPCPVCGHAAWTVGNQYVVISLSPQPTEIHMGGPVYPTIAIICSNCGNTHLINMLILGFSQEELKSMGFTVDVTAK
jgi:hypothetical protein